MVHFSLLFIMLVRGLEVMSFNYVVSPFGRSSDHPKEQHNGNKVSIVSFSSRYEIVNFLLISYISQKVHCYKIPTRASAVYVGANTPDL